MTNYLEQWKVAPLIPEGTSGDWKIERFTVPKRVNWQAVRLAMEGRPIEPGEYTRLMHRDDVIMSDTPAEIRDHRFIDEVMEGNLLIAGLGMGMITLRALRSPKVEHVTVVEIEQDVLNLTAPALLNKFPKKLTIIKGDIWQWLPDPGQKFAVGWFDIWPTLETRNLKEMGKLSRRFLKYVLLREFWGREFLQREKRRERRNVYSFF